MGGEWGSRTEYRKIGLKLFRHDKRGFRNHRKILDVCYGYSHRIKNWCMMRPEIKSCIFGKLLEGGSKGGAGGF